MGRTRTITESLQRLSRNEPSGCRVWQGHRFANGYGCIMRKRKALLAHRVAYIEAKGPIPDGMVIDHLCRNRACVNPDHLEVVSNRENLLRGNGWSGLHARRTHCPSGHQLQGEPGSHRICAVCRQQGQKRRFAALPRQKRDEINAQARRAHHLRRKRRFQCPFE